MSKCFVIQPFDKGKFDSRYEEIFKPAIESCGLIPYRIDKDPTANILIEDIEKNIKNSTLCLAEITTDNPNVWYELGYAIACNKDVVMVCSNERETSFPFDVRHRSIIKYETDSPGAYENLKKNIINRLTAILKKEDNLEKISNSFIKETEGLSSHEINLLVSIVSNQRSDEEVVWSHTLEQDMYKNGFNDLAISIAIKKLERKGFIEAGSEMDRNGYPTSYFRVTKDGEEWVIDNEDKLSLNMDIMKEYPGEYDIPF